MLSQPASTAMETVVIDAGGRYGPHPAWRSFEGELRYLLFEPDVREAERLAAKYATTPHIEVVAQALGDRQGRITINVLRHRGQSTAFTPNPEATWFRQTRQGEGDVVDRYEAPVTTIDLFCEERGLGADFLKVDTEGSEFAVLRGAENQLRENVLGLRCELQFDDLHVGAPSLPEVYGFLRDAGFLLLNLDYTGAGAHFGPFFDGPRYGILSGSDSVWARPPQEVLGSAVPERVVKYATFCMHNHATDLALHVLESAVVEGRLDLARLSGTRLMRGLDVAVQHLFYRLSHKPRYEFEFLDRTYHVIFGRHLKPMHEFYESDEVNPA